MCGREWPDCERAKIVIHNQACRLRTEEPSGPICPQRKGRPREGACTGFGHDQGWLRVQACVQGSLSHVRVPFLHEVIMLQALVLDPQGSGTLDACGVPLLSGGNYFG